MIIMGTTVILTSILMVTVAKLWTAWWQPFVQLGLNCFLAGYLSMETRKLEGTLEKGDYVLASLLVHLNFFTFWFY